VRTLLSDGIVLKSKLSKLVVDLRRFMKLLEDDPSFLEPRSSFPIIRGNDNKWHKAKDMRLIPLTQVALDVVFARPACPVVGTHTDGQGALTVCIPEGVS